MENDAFYQYAKLVLENLSIWPVLILAGLWWLIRHPEWLKKVPEYISKFKIGGLEVELRQLKEKLEETNRQVETLENELEREQSRFQELLSDFDPHAPVSELARTREALKAMAPGLADLSIVRSGLGEDASAEEIYAAAEIARSKRDVALFDDLVACLDRLARQDDLGGVRLHTVWTLTSALHKTLLSDVKHGEQPRLSARQLQAAKAMLERLVRNPRVLQDRPDAPLNGVRGPAKWAGDWIEKGLEKLSGAGT